jgi:nitroreductase
MNLLKAIESRRSIRTYTSNPVEAEKVEAIVKASNLAPIFGQIHITVIENQQLLKEITNVTLDMMKHSDNEFLSKTASMEGYNPLYGAPVMIVLSTLNGNDSYGFNMANVSCSAENILIQATELELGSCFVMSPTMAFSNPDLFKKSGIPEDYVPLCCVLLGYANVENIGHKTENKNNVNYCK